MWLGELTLSVFCILEHDSLLGVSLHRRVTGHPLAIHSC